MTIRSQLKTLLASLLLVSGVVACSEQPSVASNSAEVPLVAGVSSDESDVERWYSAEQVAVGQGVFLQNCALCHGEQAQGTVEDWRARLDDGSFPPPPLDGSAHAWHHPQEILLRVIDYGGESLGGKMPAFIDVLEQEEKLAAIAYFQDFWTDDIYQQWMQMGGTN